MALAAIGPAMLSGAAIESLPRWRGRRDLLPIVFVPLLFVAVVAVVLWQAGRTIGWQPLVAATLTTALIAVAVATPRVAYSSKAPGNAHGPGDAGRRTCRHRPYNQIQGGIIHRAESVAFH